MIYLVLYILALKSPQDYTIIFIYYIHNIHYKIYSATIIAVGRNPRILVYTWLTYITP